MDDAVSRAPELRGEGDALLARAAELLGDFQDRIAGVPYEPKGILFSEMLFLWASVPFGFRGQILESGRARAQSTLLLSRLFPEHHVVSIERDRASPDVAVAAARLRDAANVEALFGDSRELLPERVRPGDVVLIDGPKGSASLRLALEVLDSLRAGMVFLHDCSAGTFQRSFLDRHVGGTRFSDAASFVRGYAHLDEPCWAALERGDHHGWRPFCQEGRPQRSYGPTLAVIPRGPGFRFGAGLRLRFESGALVRRLRRSLLKRLGRLRPLD